MYTNGSVIPW